MSVEAGRAVVYLGNRQAVEGIDRTPLPGKLRTTVLVDASDLRAAVVEITHPGGVWAAHSDADAPAWVASTNDQLAAMLSAWWGCEQREPDDGQGVA